MPTSHGAGHDTPSFELNRAGAPKDFRVSLSGPHSHSPGYLGELVEGEYVVAQLPPSGKE